MITFDASYKLNHYKLFLGNSLIYLLDDIK